MKRTVIQLLYNAAKKYPTVAYLNEKVEKNWVGKTYPEVISYAQKLALGLQSLGLKYQDKVALISEGRTNWVIAEFGALMARTVVVPLSIKLLPEEIAFRINHSKSAAIFVSSNVLEKVCSAWELFDNKNIYLIYLDTNTDFFAKMCEKYKIHLGNKFVQYHELIENATVILTQKPTKIDETISQIEENDIVTISYTSGTTGNPKGIMLSHLNYYANSSDAVKHFKLAEEQRTLLILPLDHSFAHTVGIYSSLSVGLKLHFVDSRGSAMAALKNIPINLKEVNPHFILTVPALTGNFMAKMIEGVAQKGGFVEKLFHSGIEAGTIINGDGFRRANFVTKLKYYPTYKLADKLIFSKLRLIFGDSLQYCVGGGALLDIKQQHFYAALGIPIYQGYGLSEATPIISSNTPSCHKMGTSGTVLETLVCKILDDQGREMPVGKKGEIVIKGLNVMQGYFQNTKATEETVRGEWLHTGDLGYYDADGFLVVTGREKALLISQDGEKYSPEGIEEAIANCSQVVHQAMLYNDHSKYTTAVISLNRAMVTHLIEKNQIRDSRDLLNLIKDELHLFKKSVEYKDQFPEKWIPNVFVVVAEPFTEQNLMINSTLKMVRYKITEAYRKEIDFLYTTQGNNIANEHNIAVLNSIFDF
ncbi:MAG: hypothetical protein RIS47_2344 [Bacteroidota bacterium]|jgi:long-chain acyl-CoA synthetase